METRSYALRHAASTALAFAAVSGPCRTRAPVASKMALLIAAAVANL